MMNTRLGAVGLGLAIVLSLAGMILTGLLLDYQVKMATGGKPLAGSLCKCDRFDCTEALESPTAYLSLGGSKEASIPTSLLAFIYFTAMTAWFLIVGRPSGSRYGWHGFALLLALIGAGGAGYLAYQSKGLSQICLPCMIGQCIAGVLLLLTVLLWPRRRMVAVMAEPVSGPVRGPLPVRVPAPDYPPGRALLAWLLTTAGVSVLGWLGYSGTLHAADRDQSLSHYRQQAEEARTEATTEHSNAERFAAEAAAAKTLLKSADEQRATAVTELDKVRTDLTTAITELTNTKAELTKANTERTQATTDLTKANAELAQATSELATAKANLAEAQRASQDVVARLKDYEDDYQAVWFNFMNEPQVNIPVDQNDSIRGKVDAPHTIVMFVDLQCPYCQGADKVLQQKLAKFPNQLRLVVKHFPLDKSCNVKVTGSLHPAACPAAVTVEAARAVGGEEGFWRMYDEMFAHQAEFAKSPREFVKGACERIGINNDELWKKINSTSIWNRIKEQTEQGGALGVDGTPAVYYDGRKVAGWANSKFWDFIMWREAQMGGTPTVAPAPAPTTPPATQPATQPAAPATQPH